MLQTLEDRSSAEAKQVLAAVSATVIPQPFDVDFASRYDTTEETVNSVLTEIRQKLQIPENDLSQQARSKIVDFLNKTLSEMTFADVDKSAVKARLGQRGDLSLSFYETRFSEKFDKKLAEIGLKKSDVQKTLREPDAFEHLKSMTHLGTKNVSTSYLAKNFKIGSNSYTVLVVVDRFDFVLKADDAWKIYHDEVDVDQKMPRQIFESFLELYGVDVTLGGKTKKYFSHETIKLDPNGSKRDFEFQAPLEKDNNYFVFAEYGGNRNSDVLEVFRVYVVNLDKYKESLRRHGTLVN